MNLDEVWKTKINKKWLPVYYYQGKKANYHHDPFYKRNCLREMIMRFDSLFTSINGFNGNDTSIIDFYRRESKMINYLEDKNLNEWYKWWGADNYNYGEGLFVVDLISSSNAEGPWSWFNPKTGKIGASNYFEYIDTLGEFREELEWFVSEFDELDLYISFATNDNDDNPTITLHLANKKIEIVPTIKKFPKHKGYYPKKVTIKDKVIRKFYRFIKKYFECNQKSILASHLWESYVMYHDVGNILKFYERESYFKSIAQIRYLINWWVEKCRWYNFTTDKEKK